MLVVTLSDNLGAAFGVWFGGRLFDLSGRYTFTFMTAIVSGVLAIASMWTGNALPARLQAPAERSPTA
jgi:predicted MFS family arabinose efflux permease